MGSALDVTKMGEVFIRNNLPCVTKKFYTLLKTIFNDNQTHIMVIHMFGHKTREFNADNCNLLT